MAALIAIEFILKFRYTLKLSLEIASDFIQKTLHKKLKLTFYFREANVKFEKLRTTLFRLNFLYDDYLNHINRNTNYVKLPKFICS